MFNRATRRSFLGGISAAATVLVVACSPQAVTTFTALEAKVVSVSQGLMSSLTNALSVTNTTLTGAALAAYTAAQAAVAQLPAFAQSSAAALANFVTAPATSIESLVVAAARFILGVLPGTSTVVGIINDVITVAPLVTAFANSILNPSAASAPASGAMQAAQRLGIEV